MSKIRGFIVIAGGVFAMGFIGVMLANLVGTSANIWELHASTYQIAVTAGIVAVFVYLGTVVFPVVIRPGATMRFPEA
jgi:hypothetical protein